VIKNELILAFNKHQTANSKHRSSSWLSTNIEQQIANIALRLSFQQTSNSKYQTSLFALNKQRTANIKHRSSH
jgi:hypothetical protein